MHRRDRRQGTAGESGICQLRVNHSCPTESLWDEPNKLTQVFDLLQSWGQWLAQANIPPAEVRYDSSEVSKETVKPLTNDAINGRGVSDQLICYKKPTHPNCKLPSKEMKQSLQLMLAALVAISASAFNAHAAPIVTVNISNTLETPYAVSATDLVNAGQLSLLSRVETGFVPGFGSNAANLNDGSAGLSSVVATTTIGDPSILGWISTFTLDTSVNTFGYDINGITTIAGWPSDRSGQGYRVKYTLVGNATVFTLGDFLATGVVNSDTASQIQITNVGLTGVDSLIFEIATNTSGGANGQVAYREIDVFGVASVPEPSTVALAGISGLGMLFAFRRRSKVIAG